MNSWRLVSYRAASGPRPGLLVDDRVLDLPDALASFEGRADRALRATTVLDLLGCWEEARPMLDEVADYYAHASEVRAPERVSRPLSEVTLLAPILYPGALFCAAANYRDHAREMQPDRPELDKSTARPYFFLKATPHSVLGPDETIRIPATTRMLDWEAEIGAVIGASCSNVSEADAMRYVAGYTIVNDLSARDLGRRSDWSFGTDWFGQKTFDGSAPLGPWLTPAAAVDDPHDLTIQLWVNDTLMQDSSSRQMIFTIPEQIAYLSRHVTLRPGDVIATGTPAGVGRPRGIFLKPGDSVTITIERLGTLRNAVA